MSKDIIGALRVTLGFDTSQFEHGSKKAKDTAARDMRAIRNDIGLVTSAIRGLGAAFIGSEAIAAARRALDYAASIKSVAQEAGVTTLQLQEYRFAASEAGVSQKDMDASLKVLTKNIGEARAGTKAQAELFAKYKISIEDGVTKSTLNAAQVMPQLADAISKIKDPITRARVEAKFLNEELGPKLDEMLSQGSEGLNRLRKAAYDTGVVLSDQQIQNADKTAAKLEQVKIVLSARIASVITDNTDAVNLFAKSMERAASAAAWFFQTWKGSARIMRDEGWASGFFASPSRQENAGDPLKYLQNRTGELVRATASRRQIEAGGINTRADQQALAQAKAREAEALRLMRAAQNDPDFQRVWAAELNRNAVGNGNPSGALPVPNPGRTRKGPKDRTEELAERYQRELGRLQDDELGLKQDLISDIRHRAQLEHERIEHAQNDYNKDVDSRVKQGELTAAQAKQLKLQNDRNTELEHSRVNWKLDDELLAEETRVAQDSLDRERDMLQIRASLATTAKERRETQLALLDNELESMRLSAEEVLARHDSTDAEKKLAQAKLDQLANLRAGSTLQINRETMGPLETYFDSIPDTAHEINEAYENIAANGLRNFNDGLADSASNMLKLKGVAGTLFNQLISDLIRFQMQQAMGGGGLFGSLLKLGGSLLGGGNALAGSLETAYANVDSMAADVASRNASGAFSFAGGGDMTILGRRGIDRNVLSLNGLPIANVSYGEKLSIANDNVGGRMASVVYVNPSPYFDAVVDQRAYGVAAPMSMQAASAGSNGAQVAIARSGSRRIP